MDALNSKYNNFNVGDWFRGIFVSQHKQESKETEAEMNTAIATYLNQVNQNTGKKDNTGIIVAIILAVAVLTLVTYFLLKPKSQTIKTK
ncbi:MAG: hypothetical protein WCT85_00730 [Parachlamydiales bacterium]|jgi:hypothetical protein